ncbi:Virulence plasmid 28 protein [Pseudomonas sp. IT-P44]|uniref:Tc toxin subunit A n=1 Tax=Pseudomonas sp. IT-P44 TaxID=3026451 RepID=UPI0039E10121
MSNNHSNPALERLFELTPRALNAPVTENLGHFIDNGGSVYKLLKMGRQRVVETFGLHSQDAQVLLDKAMALAVHTAREFREQRLVRSGPPNPLHRTGIRAWEGGPDFDRMFAPDWGRASPSQSPDSSISPAAYFLRLVVLARDLEARSPGVKELIKFETRRPDLVKLIIDTTSMFQIKPTVTLVSEVLESIIKTFLTPPALTDRVVDDHLLEKRFPFRSLPFEWYFVQWEQVLQANKLSLGEVVRTIDESGPYFKQPGARGDLSDIALHQSCNIGPQGQLLLTEDFLPSGSTPVQWTAFYKDNFGSTEENLKDSVHFCAKTSINADDVTSLLSIEGYAPKRSSNVAEPQSEALEEPEEPEEPQLSKVFGSTYINYGSDNAMDLSEPGKATTRKFTSATHNRFERMNRILRLSRWLELPVNQCDRLIMAAFNAELRGDIRDPQARKVALATKPSRITSNTLRAIGLFQEFRLRFKCSAEQFAALIDEISPYSRGEELSQFDRIFNAQALFDAPLKADKGYFAIEAQTRADKRTVDQICTSLGINQETWRYLARFVAKSYNLRDELQRSLPIFSSLYRLVLLASFLRISAIELAALLETFSEKNGSELLQRVLGESVLLVSGTSGVGDVLNVMQAAQSCVQWAQENDLSVLWLVQKVAPVIAPPLATEAEVTLLQEVHKRLHPVRFSEEALRAAGVPPSNDSKQAGWLSLLLYLVDLNGLVLEKEGDEEDYERVARGEIQSAVELANLSPDDGERVRNVILALLLQARDAQRAVVQESLSVYLRISQDLALPLLRWVDRKGVYLLLLETARALDAVTSGTEKVKVGDDVLSLLAHLVRRAEVVQQLGLSSAMLVALTLRENWEWFGLKHPKELKLSTLYYLTLFQRVVADTGQPAEKLLHYLELVNGLPENLTPEDVRLIRDSAASLLADVVQWGVREVLECILYLKPNPKIQVIRDMTSLDTLLRIRALAIRTGLDAKALIGLGALTPDSDKYACRSAAEHVLEKLSGSVIQGQTQLIGEVGQSVTHEIRCINDTLIANVNGQYAMIELTLRDLTNQVVPNVTVSWNSDRPGLLASTSITDHEGRAVVRFKPEKSTWMGAVQIKATYGLAQVVYAPKILIDCDESTLDFDIKDPDPKEDFLAGGHASFAAVVRLVDKHGNPGVGRPVTFSGRGVVADPSSVLSDENGYARTRITSIEPIEKASVVVSYSTKDPLVINNITFVDQPSIKLLEVVSMAVAGQPLVIHCHVVGLGKLPSVDVEVELISSGTDPASTKAVTNDQGIAEFTVSSPKAGNNSFTAKVKMGQQQLDVYVASSVFIHGKSQDYKVLVVGVPTSLWVDAREEQHNQAKVVARCPIWWTVTKKAEMVLEAISYPTDALGRSTFPYEFEEAGEYVVTAVLKSTPEENRTFNVTVVAAIEWEYTLTDLETGTVIRQVTARERLEFIRGRSYKLEIEMPDSVDLSDARAMLAWTGEYSAAGLGMVFSPPTGAYVLVGDLKTLSWVIVCKDLRNSTFDLTFSCDRIDQRLVLPGRLDAPAPKLSYPVDGSTEVEVQPLLHGKGSPSAQIYIFENRDEKALLARTSVRDDGTWSVRLAEVLSLGPHVLSVKQRHIDTTEAWAKDASVKVSGDFVDVPTVLKPATDSTVRAESWIEGLGLPGVEVRVVKGGSPAVIYASGMVDKNGHWRVQFKPTLGPGKHSLAAGFSVDGANPTTWISYSLTVVPKS